MSLQYRTATVFGGSGFLGRHLVRRLAKAGCLVRVATRDRVGAEFLRTTGMVGQVTPMPCSAGNDAAVATLVEGADIVVNLIGTLAPGGRDSFQSVHAEAAGRIASQARAAGAQRLLHVSALGADTAGPSDYARSKAAGEAAVLAAFPAATIFRPSILFGPEDHFFNRFAGMARVAPFLPVFGGGATKFQPVYVGDVADAMMAALQTDASKGEIYELGGPRSYSFLELMRLMLQVTQRNKMLVSLPWGVASLMGAFLQFAPGTPLSPDQVRQLQRDNVLSGTKPGLAELGIAPTSAEVILPTYLARFRVGGQFAGVRRA
jgi:uncharacterized protein YbjT (DUF2867 family)